MSKFSDDFEKTLKDIRTIRQATKDVIDKGGKLLMEEFYNANSFERLKKYIIGGSA